VLLKLLALHYFRDIYNAYYLHNITQFNIIDDDEVNGPGICRRLPLRRVNCWDGNNRRDVDIDEFDVDDIDGQGMIKITMHNWTLKHSLFY
jgi:hypothetical protein